MKLFSLRFRVFYLLLLFPLMLLLPAFTSTASAGGSPAILVQKTWGGSSFDKGESVAVDSSGNIYVTGYTQSFGAGLWDVLLLKLDSSGALVWQKTWGGSGYDAGEAVVVDSSGNIYVTGYTDSFGAGGPDVLLLKFDSSGSLLWQKTWGGPKWDQGNGVAVDASGNIYVTGYTLSFGAGSWDVLLLKFDSSGSLLWQKTWGGSGIDYGFSVAVDSSGYIYVAGDTNSFGAGGSDVLLLKFDSSGALVWQKTWGGTGDDEGFGVAVDASGNIYVTGDTNSLGAPNSSVVLLRFDSSGALIWQKTWGGGDAAGIRVAVDSSGNNIYVAGTTNKYGGKVLLLKLDSAGSLIWQKSWGGTGADEAFGVAVDPAGNAVLTGFVSEAPPYTLSSPSFTLGTPSFTLGVPIFLPGSPTSATGTPAGVVGTPTGSESYAGSTDEFLLIYGVPPPTLISQKTWGGSQGDVGYSIAVDAYGNTYDTGITGSFGPGSPSHTALKLLRYTSAASLLWQRIWSGSGNGSDAGIGVALDFSGSNIYVTGSTTSFGAGAADVLLLKFASSGTLIWQEIWGGSFDDVGRGVAVDAKSGSIYVTGFTNSFGAGGSDLLLLKFDSSGTLIWQKTWGGSSDDIGHGIAVDASGNIYVAGETNSAFGLGGKVCLLKFDSSGGLTWQKTWGGGSSNTGRGVAVDAASGDIYVTGTTNSFGVGGDVFVLKFDSSGALVWQKTWGGSGYDAGQAVVVDSSGNIYVTGATVSFGAGSNDAFLLLFDSAGSLIWQKTWGGAGDDRAFGVAVDPAGNAVLTGFVSEAPPYTLGSSSYMLGTPSFALSTSTYLLGTPNFATRNPPGGVGTPAGSESYAGSSDEFLLIYGVPPPIIHVASFFPPSLITLLLIALKAVILDRRRKN